MKTVILHLTEALILGGTSRVMQNFAMLANREVFIPVLAGLRGDQSFADRLREQGFSVGIVGDDLSKLTSLLQGKHTFAVLVHRSGEETGLWNRALPALANAGATVVLERSVFGNPDWGPASGEADIILCNSLHTLWRHWWASDQPSPDEYLRRHRVIYEPIVLAPAKEEFSKARHLQREALNIPPDAFVIGDVCRPTPIKLDFMMAAVMPRLCREQPGVYFVARCFPDAVADAMARRLGDRFRNLPVTSDPAEVVATYATLDVFAHMSTMGEASGMAMTEAMWCGVPVVANETPGRKQNNAQIELIVNGENGFLASDPYTVFLRLLELARAPEFRRRLSAAAKARFQAPPYSAKSVIEQLESEVVRIALEKGWHIPGAAVRVERQPSNHEMREYLLNYRPRVTVQRLSKPLREASWTANVNARRWLWRLRRKLGSVK